MSDVFISYSRKNKDFARKITDELRLSGKDSWVDWEGIPLSSPNWWHEITAGIDLADNFVFIMSPDSMMSVVCNMELDYALDLNKRVILVVHEDVDTDVALASLEDFTPDEAMKERLAGDTVMQKAQDNLHRISHINWLFFREDDDFDTAYQQLLTTVETDLDYVKSHTRYLGRAREWHENNRRVDLLLFGDEIALAEQWLAQGDEYFQEAAARAEGTKVTVVNPIPDQLHRDYISESRRAEDERQQHLQELEDSRVRSEKSRQRAQRVGAIAGVIGVIAIILSVIAGMQAAEASNTASTAQAQADIAEEEAEQSGTLVAEADVQLAEAEEQLANAGTQVSVADAQVTEANNQIVEANTQVAIADAQVTEANDQLAEADAQLEKAGTQVAVADAQVTEVNNQIAGANTQVAEANATLTPIPPTLTQVANQLESAIIELDNAEATRQAVETFSNSVQIAAKVDDIFENYSQPLGLSLAMEASVIDDTAHAIRVLSETAYKANTRYRYDSWSDVPDGIKNRLYDVGADITYNDNISGIGGNITSPDGRLEATIFTNFVQLQNADSGQVIREFRSNAVEGRSITFSPDGNLIATSWRDEAIIIWNVNTGELLHHLNGHSQAVIRVRFTNDGTQLFSFAEDDSVFLWDLNPGNNIRRDGEFRGSIHQAEFNESGDEFVAVSTGGTIIVRDTDTGDIKHLYQLPHRLSDVAYSTDGESVVVASSSGVQIVNIETGDATQLPGIGDDMSSVDVDPTGNLIAASTWNRNIRSFSVWDARTENLINTFADHFDRVLSVRFSDNGDYLVVTGDYAGVTLWDVRDPNNISIVHDYRGHRAGLWHAEMSPDGKQVISTSWDSEIRLWDVDERNLIRRFIGSATPVLSARMSPDQKTIVSGSTDGTIILWDAETGEILQRFDGHDGAVYSVTFSPSGDKILSGSADGTTILWRIDDLPQLQNWVRENRYLPELSCDERDSYGLETCVDDVIPATPTFVPTSTATD